MLCNKKTYKMPVLSLYLSEIAVCRYLFSLLRSVNSGEQLALLSRGRSSSDRLTIGAGPFGRRKQFTADMGNDVSDTFSRDSLCSRLIGSFSDCRLRRNKLFEDGNLESLLVCFFLRLSFALVIPSLSGQ